MMKEEKKKVEAPKASNFGMLEVEQFLYERYLFRLNVLNRKVEYVSKSSVDEVVDDADARWQTLTDRDLNSIILTAKREDVCKGSPKADIELVLHSKDVRTYDPIREYLEHLPQWDGQNHVANLFSRLPGLSSEQMGFLATWLRSCVAHWL